MYPQGTANDSTAPDRRAPGDDETAAPKTPAHPALPPEDDAAAPAIRLDHFLQKQDLVQSGGHAKIAIQNGEVTVDGVVETRRRRKLTAGQRVSFAGQAVDVP